MIQAKKLGHLVLNVRDAAKSKDFYTRTLGLQVAHEDTERGTVFLSFGKEHHDLALFQMARGETPNAAQPVCTTWRGSSGASRSCRPRTGS